MEFTNARRLIEEQTDETRAAWRKHFEHRLSRHHADRRLAAARRDSAGPRVPGFFVVLRRARVRSCMSSVRSHATSTGQTSTAVFTSSRSRIPKITRSSPVLRPERRHGARGMGMGAPSLRSGRLPAADSGNPDHAFARYSHGATDSGRPGSPISASLLVAVASGRSFLLAPRSRRSVLGPKPGSDAARPSPRAGSHPRRTNPGVASAPS